MADPSSDAPKERKGVVAQATRVYGMQPWTCGACMGPLPVDSWCVRVLLKGGSEPVLCTGCASDICSAMDVAVERSKFHLPKSKEVVR